MRSMSEEKVRKTIFCHLLSVSRITLILKSGKGAPIPEMWGQYLLSNLLLPRLHITDLCRFTVLPTNLAC